MSAYIDHRESRIDGHRQTTVTVVHSWQLDRRQRLAWLYGDADERILLGKPDRDAWRRLGALAKRVTAA